MDLEILIFLINTKNYINYKKITIKAYYYQESFVKIYKNIL